MSTTVKLGQHETDFVEAEVKAGRFASPSDVVREALALLETLSREPGPFEGEDLDRLQVAWAEGVASAEAGEPDFEALKREGRRRLAGQGQGPAYGSGSPGVRRTTFLISG